MPLVSMTEMLNKAKEEKYAVGQFNLNNLEFTQAILQAAEEEKISCYTWCFRRCCTLYGRLQVCRENG